VNAGQTTSGDPKSITVRIDPGGNIVKTQQPFGSGPYGALADIRSIAAVGDAIWEPHEDDSAGPGVASTVLRIDSRTGRVTLRMRPKIQGNSDSFPDVMTAGDSTLWLQTGPSAIKRIDPTTGRVLRRMAIPLVGKRPATDYWSCSIAAAPSSYWITVWPGQRG